MPGRLQPSPLSSPGPGPVSHQQPEILTQYKQLPVSFLHFSFIRPIHGKTTQFDIQIFLCVTLPQTFSISLFSFSGPGAQKMSARSWSWLVVLVRMIDIHWNSVLHSQHTWLDPVTIIQWRVLPLLLMRIELVSLLDLHYMTYDERLWYFEHCFGTPGYISQQVFTDGTYAETLQPRR